MSTTPPWNREEISIDTTLRTKISKEDPIQYQHETTINLILSYTNYLHVYTDASQNAQHHTGASFYIPEDLFGKEMRLPNHTTVHTAEIYAIKAAVEYIDNDNRHDIKIAIFSDSLSAVQEIEYSVLSTFTSIATDIADSIHCLTKKNINTTIIWIPAHVGIHGNELADRKAKRSTLQSSPIINIPSTIQERYRIIDQQILLEWQNLYNSSNTGRHYKSLQPTVDRSIKYSCNNRHQETVITRLRLGKCHLNKYLHEIKAHPTGFCNYCNTDETVEHFLMHCHHSNIFHKKPITLSQGLTEPDHQTYIYERIKELQRKI